MTKKQRHRTSLFGGIVDALDLFFTSIRLFRLHDASLRLLHWDARCTPTSQLPHVGECVSDQYSKRFGLKDRRIGIKVPYVCITTVDVGCVFPSRPCWIWPLVPVGSPPFSSRHRVLTAERALDLGRRVTTTGTGTAREIFIGVKCPVIGNTSASEKL